MPSFTANPIKLTSHLSQTLTFEHGGKFYASLGVEPRTNNILCVTLEYQGSTSQVCKH